MRTPRRTFLQMSLAAPALIGLSGRGWAQDLPLIRISGSAPVVRPDHAMRFLGIPMGYYETLGFRGDYLPTQGSAAGLQLLLNGEVEVAGCGFLEFIKAKSLQPDMPVHMYHSQERKSGYEVVVPEDGPIASIADLAGKSLGVPSLASGALPFARGLLRTGGVDPNTVDFLPIGVGPQALAALKSGEVDGLAMFGGSIAALELLGEKFRIFTAPIGAAGNVMSDRFVQENPELATAIFQGLVLNQRIMRSNPQEAVRAYWSEFGAPAGEDEKQLNEGVYYIQRTAATFQELDDPQPWGRYTEGEWEAITTFFEGIDDLIPEGAERSQFFSDALIEDGNKIDLSLAEAGIERFRV